MKFLTYYSEMAQTSKPNIWITKHNQLFLDEDGTISLVPRYFRSDSYTIPDWLAWLGGGKMKWDNRPAIAHDFDCKFHAFIKVNLVQKELREKGYLRHYTKVMGDETFLIPICEDIPPCYLSVEKIGFNAANSKFKRMMKATGQLKNWRINLMRFAVNFNAGWVCNGKREVDLDSLYKDFI